MNFMTTIAVFYKNMKRFVVTIFNLRYHSINKVNIAFTNKQLVTLDSVYQKVKTKLNTESFMIISWSPVDEFSV